ncbi:glycosyltransferase family 2 protein [Humisphaera borealis]|uniref:Glycosyltransferase n=1 Tax=Humisphaera borealis TaxID=2807512 RepID=A0A7M2WP98_9BACT|nr:glycosyltransferase family 2 protein [Humisphaera borealis]QOV87357.1 glycosyltransferase [Humisphaera borealis]
MKISIVTPTLNRRDYLASTGQSILSQKGQFDLEWIVVDGGSTDGSVPWLEELSRRNCRVRYTSEPDAGQSDAINKGLAMATGDVVAWLNADDLYADDTLAAVAQVFEANAGVQWLVGGYEVIDADGRSIRRSIVRYKRRRLARYSYAALLRENIIPQPAVFWRRSFGEQIGRLDTSLHWTMDYDLWLRMAKQSPPRVLDRLLARFRHHGTSKSGDFNRRQFDEGYEVARRHACGDRRSLVIHRLNVEKIVWAYRVMRLIGK